MFNLLDPLIGPALHHPQPPREGEIPGSRRHKLPWRGAVGALAAATVVAWTVRRTTRTFKD